MAAGESDGSPPSKRRKVAADAATSNTEATITESETVVVGTLTSKSLDRPISPPLSRRRRSRTPEPSTPRVKQQQQHRIRSSCTSSPRKNEKADETTKFLPSPIQLTRIKDLSPAQNVDTVGLDDILGDPMIKECWNFNFLFDIDFVMKHFDADVRYLVQLKIVHGFWKREDENRSSLQEAAKRYSNIELISAYMPDPFGTHHSKMLILLRHDDLAQVIIHTANMIERDWGNMSQAVWRSPLLPIQAQTSSRPVSQDSPEAHPIGSGERFKTDLLRYINAYGKRLTELTKLLTKYDFSAIRAAFIGSAPSRQKPVAAKPSSQTSWGWLGLREILSSIPISNSGGNKVPPHIVLQVSSIATLGPTPAWLTHFQSVLSRHSTNFLTSSTVASDASSKRANFFNKREPVLTQKISEPKFNIIFPTAHEIRTSLDGYNSGASIHTKLQSVAQQKQLLYLRPIFCHWKHSDDEATQIERRKAHRGPAAPHIKTYIRFNDTMQEKIDWAMVTSANLSKQAWGEVENKKEEVWIQSWECGVVVWPALFSSGQTPPNTTTAESVEMVPVFGKDMPGEEDLGGGDVGKGKTVIGFRMPYDLPLEPYKSDEVPWCASADHDEADWKGQIYNGYHPHA